MGRALQFSLFGHEQIPWHTRREIELARHMLNHHFSWTCETLNLELFDQVKPTYTRGSPCEYPKPSLPCLGDGHTKVGGDAWNAHLVVTYFLWVSSQAPEVTVRIHDEGDYIRAGYLVIQDGILTLDLQGVARWREYLRSNGFGDYLAHLDEAEELANAGVFFASVSAKDYADRPEIAKLGLSDSALATATLKEVSDAIVMPWQTEWLTRGKR